MMDNYYYQLNQSHKNLNNKDYIKKTTKMMNEVLKNQASKETLLVVGAGNLSDFDIGFFLSVFETVTLSDIDTVTIKEALGKYVNHPKIEVVDVDYIGVGDTNFYEDFDKLLTFNHYSEVERFFERKLGQLKAYHFSSKFNKTFDAIYISPIYTQLFYREVETKLKDLVEKGFSNQYKEKILPMLFQSMMDFIDCFNKEIVALIEDKGTVFVGSDIFYLKDDMFSQRAKEAISDNEAMTKIHSQYQNDYGRVRSYVR
jgi:hypothetical protein